MMSDHDASVRFVPTLSFKSTDSSAVYSNQLDFERPRPGTIYFDG